MKRLLIDTNILLDYYRSSKQSLRSINALLDSVSKGEIEIVLPRQVIDEFYRERPTVSYATMKLMIDLSKLEVRFPEYLAKYSEVKKLKASNLKLKKSAENILEECKNRIFNPNSSINKKINQLFSKSVIIEPSTEVLQRAYYRTLKTNPPRKNNRSFGDAIIWETVLLHCSDEDLIIVSRDADFESEVQNGKINEFLQYEWEEKSKKKLLLEKGLGNFIKQPKIKKEVVAEEERISEISNKSVYMNIPIPSYSPQSTTLPLSDLTTNGIQNGKSVYSLTCDPTILSDINNPYSVASPLNLGITNTRPLFTNICQRCGQEIELTGPHFCSNLLNL